MFLATIDDSNQDIDTRILKWTHHQYMNNKHTTTTYSFFLLLLLHRRDIALERCSVQLPRKDGQLSHDAQTNLDPVKVDKSVPDDDG